MAVLVLRSKHVVLLDGVMPADVVIRAGKIAEVSAYGHHAAAHADTHIVDVGSLHVMAGVVDSHVHVNEPGRTAWEGFETATKAAAAGGTLHASYIAQRIAGVTTIVDMPLNSSPVTTSVSALEAKIKSTKDKIWIDVALLGGIIPANADDIIPLIQCFMIHSGLDEFPHVNEQQIRRAMEMIKLSDTDTVFMFHAELEGPMNATEVKKLVDTAPGNKYATFLASRPRAAENEAIALVIRLTKEYGIRTHIVHLSSADAVELVRQAREDGVRISAETTYHYLHFTAEQVAASATLFKCCPPIREAENREKLWKAVQDGVITQVVSDHSPCTTNLKNDDFMKSWGGISSLGLGLSIVWTQCRARGIPVTALTRWMSVNTASLVGLSSRKGQIATGFDADICVWDPDESFRVEAEKLLVRNKASPYVGEVLYGRVHQTFVAGRKVWDVKQSDTFERPTGAVLIKNKRIAPEESE